MTRRSLVGISAYVEPAGWAVWRDVPAALVPQAYVRAVTAAGGRAVVLPPDDVERLEGLLVAHHVGETDLFDLAVAGAEPARRSGGRQPGLLAEAGDLQHPAHLSGRQHGECAGEPLGQPDHGVDRRRIEEGDRAQVQRDPAGGLAEDGLEHGVGGGHVDLARHGDPVVVAVDLRGRGEDGRRAFLIHGATMAQRPGCGNKPGRAGRSGSYRAARR